MTVKKQFHVFGELVQVLVTSEETQGAFCVVRQYSLPGGGPPPHVHRNEDECFTVIEGEYELFDGTQWKPVSQGEVAFTLRSHPHTFRNRGNTTGCMQCTAMPGGLDLYLEQLSQLSMPPIMEDVARVSDPFGISFLPPAQV
ncbi:cupin domain-containing protein [Terriglobus tenax]|uniref:cupin domain-containing protein n=1 Tax=Terriglobus tenax TaxID=1111115 RepID=UPI0021E06C9F|nr:cupin domain-containing protein [Terriglobus tenax]